MGLFRREDPLDRRLRRAFTPRAEFTSDLAERVVAAAPRPRYARASRASFVAAVAVFMLGTFASFGGVGLAAQGAQQTIRAVSHVTVSQRPVTRHLTSASDQYVNAATTPKPKVEKTTPHTSTPKTTSGVAGVTTTPKTLPFTGLSLLGTMLLSLVLIAAGLAFRRAASKP